MTFICCHRLQDTLDISLTKIVDDDFVMCCILCKAVWKILKTKLIIRRNFIKKIEALIFLQADFSNGDNARARKKNRPGTP